MNNERPAKKNDTLIKTSVISLLIRSGSILSRFILIVFLGKYLDTGEYGVFGLLQSSLALGVYIVGLDIYTFTNREIPKRDIAGAQSIILSQACVFAIGYLVLLPIALTILSGDFIPAEYIFWFGALLMLEHMTFEIVRFLVALEHPLYANTLVFARSVLWIIPFVTFFYFNQDILSIKNLLMFWVSGLAAGLLVGVGLLFKVKVLPFKRWEVDRDFIKKALKGSMVFFMASVSYKTIEFSDRYFLMYYYSSFEVGIYSFFRSLVNLMDVFVYTAVVMIILPKVIKAQSNKDDLTYKKQTKVMNFGIVLGTLSLAIFMFFAINPFLAFIGKQEMIANIKIFKYLLLSATILSLSLVGHYALYVRHYDKKILYASFSGALLNTVLNFVLIPEYGLMGATVSTIISCLLMGALKLFFAKKI